MVPLVLPMVEYVHVYDHGDVPELVRTNMVRTYVHVYQLVLEYHGTVHMYTRGSQCTCVHQKVVT